MNLRQLEVFQAVMQTGNMSAAARLVCITPSAVSKTIAHAELQLGYKLFTRAKGALSPTPEAQALFGEASRIQHQLDGLRQMALNLRHADGGQVRLAALPSISHEFLPHVLQRYAARHPRTEIEVRTLHQDQMAQALLTRAVDVALGFYPHPHPQVVSAELARGPLHVAVTREIWQRALQRKRAHPLLFLADTPLIRLVGDDPMRESIDALARSLGIQTISGIQVQTSRLALELVRLGLGWTMVDFLTARNLDPAALVAVPVQELPAMTLQVYHAEHAPPGLPARRLLALLPPLLPAQSAR